MARRRYQARRVRAAVGLRPPRQLKTAVSQAQGPAVARHVAVLAGRHLEGKLGAACGDAAGRRAGASR